jgi:hypothetical protein
MIVNDETTKKEYTTPDFFQEYISNKNKFLKFNFRRNNCSNVVKEFLGALGLKTPTLTPWADTIRTLGSVNRNPEDLRPGDVVAMGTPGDTHHVGIYLGGSSVLHQSGIRGYVVGAHNDLAAFTNHRAGFYFVRPDYSPISPKSVEDLIATPQPLFAPAIGG